MLHHGFQLRLYRRLNTVTPTIRRSSYELAVVAGQIVPERISRLIMTEKLSQEPYVSLAVVYLGDEVSEENELTICRSQLPRLNTVESSHDSS
jgi:hypothetical protein